MPRHRYVGRRSGVRYAIGELLCFWMESSRAAGSNHRNVRARSKCLRSDTLKETVSFLAEVGGEDLGDLVF